MACSSSVFGQPLGGPARRSSTAPSAQAPPSRRIFGPVDQALAGEGDHAGTAVAPCRQGLGPLAGAAQLGHLLADVDHPAVDPAGHLGRELADDDRHHGLVEQGQALGDPAAGHRGRPLEEHGQPTRSASPACRSIPRAARAAVTWAGGVLAGLELLEDRRQEQVALLGAVRRLVLQQPPGPGQPAAALGELALVEQA